MNHTVFINTPSRVSDAAFLHDIAILTHCNSDLEDFYPARARARALRALGLLLADGVPIVGLVKTFWRETGRTGRKLA